MTPSLSRRHLLAGHGRRLLVNHAGRQLVRPMGESLPGAAARDTDA
ncbi:MULTISPECIES: hypothetical protein [Streptomyces]